MATKKKKSSKKRKTTRKKQKKNSFFGFAFKWLFLIGFWCTLFLAAICAYYATELPDITENASFERKRSIIVKAANGKIVKVIIETCLLNEEEKIKACELIELAKANFIKTSTGFSSSGANLADIILFKKYLKNNTQIKASGGIKNKEQALEYIKNGANRIGTSSGVEIVSS